MSIGVPQNVFMKVEFNLNANAKLLCHYLSATRLLDNTFWKIKTVPTTTMRNNFQSWQRQEPHFICRRWRQPSSKSINQSFAVRRNLCTLSKLCTDFFSSFGLVLYSIGSLDREFQTETKRVFLTNQLWLLSLQSTMFTLSYRSETYYFNQSNIAVISLA